MTTFQLEATSRRRNPVSAFLSAGRDHGGLTLAQSVLEAVRRRNGARLNELPGPRLSVAFQAETLLALMTYCYATGIYGSADIEGAMREDTVFRLLCGGEFPNEREIRRFRRSNREAIRDCLKEALRGRGSAGSRQPQEKFGYGSSAAEPMTNGRLAESQDDPLDREVDERIGRAVWIDCMTLED